ncbi:NADH dehydrogenase [ubiquinone] 1 beta subcomplex subunit 2, mitochondrial-like [Plodia interpunctella]|uniref:NADH dehydrogenase [ubiquinone] 1 beta subcomplex subunit 2, mitochondrial-like n=1 Tax=Plodia interpunctella TaxID=58824 RepID=UPI0023676C9D|nr:NADH dehydrogenase [ubiquinone] 1 beta subcomplex subunit 2, mitochondrial-like [Plodia interpunctella]
MLTKNLVSKALLIRTLKNIGENAKQTKRNAGHGVWSYRVPPPTPSKRAIIGSNIIGGLCWWWILYHVATEPEHIYGEWPYIDPSTYTDEELGIPPDSAGPLK